MLRSLDIRDVVLIGHLELTFRSGLCVLTGETGAGKSILLDALGLALGARAETRLIRQGAERAQVTAVFEIPSDHPVHGLLAEHEIGDGSDGGDDLILRRSLAADGRSRAFVNDQPVSIGLLKRLGRALVEVHGQFESQRLLDPSSHRGILDSFGGLKAKVDEVTAAHRRWIAAMGARARAEADIQSAREDEEFLRHAVDELAALDPQEGEEETLAEKRAFLMHGEKLIEAIDQAASELGRGSRKGGFKGGHRGGQRGGLGAEGVLSAAARHLEQAAPRAEGLLDDAIKALDRAALEAAEAQALLDKAAAAVDLDSRTQEAVEERLFALRALARKHRVTPDNLHALLAQFTARLAAVEDGQGEVERLKADEIAARAAFAAAAGRLSGARKKAAARLNKVVVGELKPLKLDKAQFSTLVETLEEKDWGETGCDRVIFQVSTNPGSRPGPLHRIASGGELSRFMLALKAVLAQADPVPTIVFDEVDSGVGGAVASAVGKRLARLGGNIQVLVVTHSPQVAALGVHHWRVSKSGGKAGVETTVAALSEAERKEEIGRMLAGATVTDEARAAAGSLLEGRAP